MLKTFRNRIVIAMFNKTNYDNKSFIFVHFYLFDSYLKLPCVFQYQELQYTNDL